MFVVIFSWYILSLQIGCATTASPIGSVTTFSVDYNGNTTRYLDHYGGMLTVEKCIAHCGFKKFNYAGLTEDNDCFCGDQHGTTSCTENEDCLSVYSSSGLSPNFAVEPPTSVKLFEEVSLEISTFSDLNVYGVYINGKITETKTSSVKVHFSELGNNTLATELGAYWGARSSSHWVTVYAGTEVVVDCPVAFQRGQEFDCTIKVISGEDLTTMTVSKDGSQVASYTSLSDPMYYQIGSNMKADRINDYKSSYLDGNHAMFININHQFTSAGLLKAFEAYVTSLDAYTNKACFQFMVFEPVCNADDQKYCQSKRSCVDASDECAGDIVTYFSSVENTMFCSDSLHFSASDDPLCQISAIPTSPLADYKIIYKLEAETDKLGNNVFKVPASESIDILPGYVLGWSTCNGTGGDIGYYPIELQYDAYYPEYAYEEIYSLRVGSILSNNYPLASTKNISHMLRANVFSSIHYSQSFTGDTANTDLSVSVSLASNYDATFEATTNVRILEVLDGLTITADKTSYFRNDVVTLTLELTVDSETLFCVNWGEIQYDGTCDITPFNPTKMYTEVGIYTVFVEARNLISSVNGTIMIEVVGTINSFSFMYSPEPIAPVETNTLMHVAVFGSGIGIANLNMSIGYFNEIWGVFLSPYFYAIAKVTFTSPENVLSIIKISHALDSHSIAAYGSVEDAISGMSMVPFSAAETNVHFQFEVAEHTGTNMTYRWEWGDENMDETNGTYNVRLFNHTYKHFGNYTVTLHGWNKIDYAVESYKITVQNRIKNLSFTGSSMDTRIGSVTNVDFKFLEGTAVTVWVDYGVKDANVQVTSPKAFNMDVVGTAIFGRGSYLFENLGKYTISVHCENLVSKATIIEVIHVAEFITNLTVRIEQDKSGGLLDYIEVNETLTIFANVDIESSVTYKYEFGDGRPPRVTDSNVLILSYAEWRTIPYRIDVTAFNFVSRRNVSVLAQVEKPVQNLTGFDVTASSSNSSYPVFLTLVITSGDDFTCDWNFKDDSPVKTVDYDAFLESQVVEHIFQPGKYEIEVNCSNRLYNATASVTAYSYGPISDFIIETFEKCKDSDELLLGGGALENIYNVECEVVFKLSDQTGTNVTYIYDFGYSRDDGSLVTATTRKDDMTHKFNYPNEDVDSIVRRVEITAESPIQSYQKTEVIILIIGLTNITLKGDDSVNRIGMFSNISGTVARKAYKPCYTIEFGDKTEKGSEYKPLLFGDNDCQSKIEYAFHSYVPVDLVPGIYTEIISYMYTNIKTYSLIITGVNDVSSISETFEIKILDLPCAAPITSWDSAMADQPGKAQAVSSFFKCRKYNILSKVIRDCQKQTAVIKRTWGLRKILYTNETGEVTVFKEIEIPGNDTRYIINERQLDYGLYHIQLNVSMYDTERNAFMDETDEQLNGYFEIKRCDLLATIAGGSGRAVGQKGIIYINASQSADPDVEPGTPMNLKFEWFCKQDKEAFSDILDTSPQIDYPDAPDPAAGNATLSRAQFKGCFGNGYGLLNGEDQTGPVLHLNTTFMLYNQLYNIWFRLSQEGRKEKVILKYNLRVVLGTPPLVSIDCKLNCLMKKNPTQKMSFVAICLNCGSNVPHYKWTMVSKTSNAKDDVDYENDTDLLKKSVTTDINKDKNLVINPSSLSPDKKYIIKLSVFWSKEDKESGSGGFSEYGIEINTPPYQSKYAQCLFNEVSGKALETKFYITCAGILDADMPLTYSWFYLPADSTTDWIACTFPRQGRPQSESFTLPAGNSERQNLLKVKVVVSDLYGATMEPIILEIRVDPKPIDSASVDALLEEAKNDPAVMGSVMNSLLDSMKSTDEENAPKVDTSVMKDKMVSMLASVQINSPAGAQMVAGTLNNAANANEKMTTDGVGKALEASANVAAFAEELSPEELADIAQKTLSASSKFTSNVAGENAAGNLRDAVGVESKLTSGVAANMVAGEAPSSIMTANGETKVSCIDPKNGGVDLGGFKLPEMDDEEGGGGGCTGASNSKGKNRYAFDESSKGVLGPTLGLELSAGIGKKKKMQNLTKPIRLVIPNVDPLPEPKHHTAYCELMRVVHLVECTVNASNLFLQMSPKHDNFTGNLFAFMNKGIAPSLVDHQHNCTLPNPYPVDFENRTQEEKDSFEKEERWRCTITSTAMEDYCEGRWCVGVIYYTNSTNTTTKLKPRDYPVEQAQCKALNYTFYAYTRACLYWDHDKGKYSSKGCRVSSESKDEETVCYCDHLTDFGGGGPFAKPQPIDFGSALSGFSNLGENPTVFSIVLALIALYFLMLIWARKKDKKNLEKVAVAELQSNHSSDTYFYEIAVQTGFKTGSTTSSEVFIKLYGKQQETSPKKLHNPHRQCFMKGDTDTFLLAVPYTLGFLKEIEIWHNNTGSTPGWFLMQVQITNVQTMEKFIFICNNWLDVAEDDGLICRKLEKADKEDLTDFSYAFAQTARKNLYDGHIWFSVFTRPAASTFTTIQRLSTCFSLLLTTMLANAMFYTGDDTPPSDAIHLGPVTLSITQIRVGFTSSLIVIPANLLIVTLFKKAGPKRDKNAEKYMTSEMEEEKGASVPVGASAVDLIEEGDAKHNRRVNFIRSILFAGREDDEDEKKRKKSKPLPHWLIYIAYFFVFVTSAVSAFFVILYGFTFGKEKSDQWVVSMLVSFFQSVLIIQPVKVLVLSLIFALLIKDPIKDDDNEDNPNKKRKKKDDENEEHGDDDEGRVRDLNSFKLPDARRLEEARQQRLTEKRIKAIIKEIVVHLMFVTLCLMVAYAASDPFSFSLSDSVRRQCEQNGVLSSYFGSITYADENGEKRKVVKANEISNRLEWFDWIRYSLIEYLFPIGWYNGDKNYLSGFIADNEASKVLAMARIRQLRVNQNSCTKHPIFVNLIVECNGGYSMGIEQTENYHYGWTPPLNRSMRLQLRRGKRKAMYLGLESPWMYQSAMDLKSFPFLGRFATYSGSSYAVNIGPKKKFAKAIVQAMKDNFWVDRYTRALIVEANIYNANTNLLLLVTVLHEILPTGGWNFYYNIQSLRLYRYVGGLGSLIMLFDLVFAIVTLVGLYKAIKHSIKQGTKTYLSNAWNMLHVIVTFCSLGAIACTIARALAVKWAAEQFQEEPELFASFAYVGQLEYFIMALIGFVVFFTNLEFLRILRFNRRIGLLTKTMSIVGRPLRSFAMIFMIIFMAYVSFAHCLYADKLASYSTVTKTFVSLTQMFLGKFKIYQFLDNAPVLGPMLFFSYMLAIQMVLINLFVGIVCDSFAEVREEADLNEEADVLSFMANRMKKMTGANTGPDAPIYSGWKTDWEVMMENFEETCENCVYVLGNFENEDKRQTIWFDSKKADDRKKNVLTAVLGLDYFLYEKEVCDGVQVLERKLRKMTDIESKNFLAAAVLKRRDDLLQEQGRYSEMNTDISSSDEDSDNQSTDDGSDSN